MSVPCVLLRNGCKCPMIGLGTWRSPADAIKQAVKDAIDVGYRHIDCAHIYRNEEQIGEAIQEKIQEGVIKRDEIFITSKLWNTFHSAEKVREACELSLKDLRVDYLDLYLMHWPMGYKENDELYPKNEDGKIQFSDVDYVDTWRAMEMLVDEGLCRAIGLSNFNKRQIWRILECTEKPICMLQIECHPYLNQQRLMEFCEVHGIAVTAYSSLGSPHSPYEKPGEYPILKHPLILKISDTHQRSAAEILLAYQLQRGIIVIPRSIDKKHMEDNLRVYEVELTVEEIADIDALECEGRFNIMEGATGHPYHPFEDNEFEIEPPTKTPKLDQ